MSRLDARLEQPTRRAARPRSPDWWQPFVASLPGEFGTDVTTPIVLQVIGSDGTVFYQSSDWSDTFRIPVLPSPPPPPSPLNNVPFIKRRLR